MSFFQNMDFTLVGRLAGTAQKGDKDAYQRFLEALVPYIRAVVSCQVHAIADIEDIVQDCLLGIHNSLHTYDPSRRIKPWINAIIHHKVSDYFRGMSRRKEYTTGTDLNVTLAAPEPNPDREKQERDIDRAWTLVERLPDGLRQAILLTKRDGLSTRDAASRLGISEAALRKRVSRAYRKLATLYDKLWESEDYE